MLPKNFKSSKNLENQTNMLTSFKLPNLRENTEVFSQAFKHDGDDIFDGKMKIPNSSNESKFFPFNIKENLSTRDKTDELSIPNNNFFVNSNDLNKEKDKKNFLGKKLKREKAQKTEKKQETKNTSKINKESEKKENSDNLIKASAKAPFFLILSMINIIGNIKLKRVNLKKLIGGVKKNKLIFKLNLYQMLCIDKKRKNKEILDNAQPEDEQLYYYFLTRTYRFLFNNYYVGNQIFNVNGEMRYVNSFPKFDDVLEYRKKRFYNYKDAKKREERIKEFKKASFLVYNNFKGCVEREPQKEKIFFIIPTPKIEDLIKKYNSIFQGNGLLKQNFDPTFKLNKEPIKLYEFRPINIFDKKLEENDNFFENKKKMNEINENNIELLLNEATFDITRKEEKLNQHFFSFDENKFSFDNRDSFFNSNSENFNAESFIRYDSVTTIPQNKFNFADIVHK